MNKTNDKLNDLSAKQTEMEDESATWQAKMLMNKKQATKARAEAEAAHKQAQNVENVSPSVTCWGKKTHPPCLIVFLL